MLASKLKPRLQASKLNSDLIKSLDHMFCMSYTKDNFVFVYQCLEQIAILRINANDLQ